MTANMHAIWLDDLAPGEGSTPIFDQLFAEVDDETRSLVLRACADEHTEPMAVEVNGCDCTELCSMGPTCPGGMLAGLPESGCWRVNDTEAMMLAPALAEIAQIKRANATKPKKKPTPRKKPAKKPAKSPLAAQEAKLRTVRGRLADEFKTLGGNDAGAVNELGVAFVCLLGLLLAPVIVAVFG